MFVLRHAYAQVGLPHAQTAPCFSRLVGGRATRRLYFNPESVPVGFVLDELALSDGLQSATFLPRQYHSTSSRYSGFSNAPQTVYDLI